MSNIDSKRRSVFRVFAAVVLWVLVGGMLSIGVALGSVLVIRSESISSNLTPFESDVSWPYPTPEAWPPAAHVGYSRHRPFCDVAILAHVWSRPMGTRVPVFPRVYTMWEIRVGFPLRCFSAWTTSQDSVFSRSMAGGESHGLWSVSLPFLGRAEIPIHPIWAGLGVNAIVFSVAAFGLARAPGVIRRWRRAGRCVGCGYSLAGLAAGATCPECGVA